MVRDRLVSRAIVLSYHHWQWQLEIEMQTSKKRIRSMRKVTIRWKSMRKMKNLVISSSHKWEWWREMECGFSSQMKGTRNVMKTKKDFMPDSRKRD